MKEQDQGATRWIADLTGLRLLAWIGLAAWFLSLPLSHPYMIGHSHDWSYFTHHALSAYLTVTRHGQLPAWDPYYCGGIPVLGNLQNNVWGPSFLFALAFGLLPGLKIAYLAFFVAGMEGTYRLGRHLGLGGAGAIAAGLCYAFTGRFTQALFDGHPPFLAFQLVPWAILALERGLDSFGWTVAGGAILAIVFLEGGAVPLPLTSIFLVLWAMCRTAQVLASEPREVPWHRPLATLAAMAAVAAGMAAFRLVPVVDTLLNNPRVWELQDWYTPGQIANMLFENHGRGGYWGDGSAFSGHMAPMLFAVAVVARDRRALLLLAIGLLAFDVSTGSSDFLGLFPLLRKLPVLENIRNPFRFTQFVALAIALGGGTGISLIERAILALRNRLDGKRDWHRAASVLIVAAAVVVPAAASWLAVRDIALYTRSRLDGVFTKSPAMTMDQPFRQSVGNRWDSHVWPAAGIGTLSCFEEQRFFVSPRLRGDLPGEEYLADPWAGTARRVGWSPHRIEIEVDLKRPTALVVNQNGHRGWHASTGTVTEIDGLLAVRIDEPGRRDVVLSFRDPLVGIGIAISILSILALGVRELLLPRLKIGPCASRSRP